MKLQLLKLITIFTVLIFNSAAKECDFSKPEVDLPANYSSNLELLQIATRALSFSQDGITYYTDLSELQKVDRRKQKEKSSPSYLDAVGRITMKFTSGKVSYCSGTLISTSPGQASRVIKSAAHCFGNTVKREKYDLKNITWETTTKSGQKIVKELNMEILEFDRDSAVLSFTGKVPFSTIKPALIETEVSMSPREFIRYDDGMKIISAGYSSDDYKGNSGKTLTYDDEITWKDFVSTDDQNQQQFAINTVAFSGGSGGALLVDVDLSEEEIENPHKQLYYVGTTLSLHDSVKYYKISSNEKAAGASRITFDTYQGIDDKVVSQLNNKN